MASIAAALPRARPDRPGAAADRTDRPLLDRTAPIADGPNG